MPPALSYSVVRADNPGAYKFTTFHDSLDIAKDEAMRLAEVHGVRFIVLKVVGYADRTPNPVKWEDC